MKVLVTGGLGFIGSHVVDRLIKKGIETVIVDNVSGASGLTYMNSAAVLYKYDIRDETLHEVFNLEKPNAVIHLAAQIDVRESQRNPLFDANVNIVGTLNVLRMCEIHQVQKLVYASSAAVYGNPEYLSIDEQHPLNPESCYGVSKSVPESYIRMFASLHGLKYTILRLANVYGPRQSSHGEAGVVSVFLDRIKQGKDLVIYGDGEQTRDFVYVEDVAQAFVDAVQTDGRVNNETMNISCGIPTSINTMVRILGDITGRDFLTTYAEPRPGDILHSYLNNQKAQELLSWFPNHTFHTGLEKTITDRLSVGSAVDH
ncbi:MULTISPECIES: NAD-dependent epimerase/dehydratase family protein [Paenibacillus]|uniref:NAD-dependent epimerase/dehydratase family protein n=1 Tax=Paenibacillus TaxID=44249 RepID=UPI00096CD95C|nr:NAD-dependent epimerase/dehydratase family protein [Paenibacillus odorifer]OMC95160.1 UDP-glucose 4-epimerase [Paenibacillus odorifer]OZQ76512.1 UDP-glucose 4-epimerase [Paenibacillus odorifer]